MENINKPFKPSQIDDNPIPPTTSKEHTVEAGESTSYTVTLGGHLDMENTTSKVRWESKHRSWIVNFQPNVSLTIENSGDVPVVNPRITVNGHGDWYDIDSLLESIWGQASNDREKIMYLWKFARENSYHLDMIVDFGELNDPVKTYNIYGAALCGNYANCAAVLFDHAGFSAGPYGGEPQVRTCHGHGINELTVDGLPILIDIDQSAFYLDRDNETLLPGDALARDHDLIKRELNFGPAFSGWGASEQVASVFGRDDVLNSYRRKLHWNDQVHRMELTLRPGEAVEYRWDNLGKYPADPRALQIVHPPFYGNGKLIYAPRLSGERWEGETSFEVFVNEDDNGGGVAGDNRESYLIFPILSPYAICGGKIALEGLNRSEDDRLLIDLSTDGKNWGRVWKSEGSGDTAAEIAIDHHLGPHRMPVKYSYFVRVGLSSATPGGSVLKDLRIETHLMMSPFSLPRLRKGENVVAYKDETQESHSVRIVHSWQENHDRIPLAPPKPIYPEVSSEVNDSILTYRWSPVEGAVAYHIQVSKHEDIRLPYRPNLDSIVSETFYTVPFTGIYSADVPYYWRLRACDSQGVWSNWSEIVSFKWNGPEPPTRLIMREENPGIVEIGWEPNPKGTRPVRYDVYGSDEHGFSISKEQHEVLGLGPQPSNFFTTTTETNLVVVSSELSHPNANRTYYRIVAIDDNGTESGCSDYIEMTHPYVYNSPPTTASVGKLYEFKPTYLRSIGDLQYRYDKTEVGFWERDEALYDLGHAPSWLSFDDDGVIRGTPGREDVGDHLVEYKIVLRSFGMHSRTAHNLNFILTVQSIAD